MDRGHPMLKNAMLALAFAAMIAGAGVIGATLAQGDPAGDDGGEERYTVRISAQRLADGGVAVGLQEQGADGAWQERELPVNGVLPAGAAVGRWASSSPLGVGGERRAVCVIHHGGPADAAFWGRFTRDMADAARQHGLSARVAGEIEHERQAAQIRRCVADGVAGIATTLPNPDVLEGAVREALDAGVVVVTFNSGQEAAERLGSAIHVSIDETAAGQRAGAAFNAAGTEGTVLCVLHEPDNVGLEERCGALEAEYAGSEVERLYVVGVSDAARTTEQIAERLGAGGVGGVLTLNEALMLTPSDAARLTGDEIVVGAFGGFRAATQIIAGRVAFAISDQPWLQAHHVATHLHMYVEGVELGFSPSVYEAAPITLVSIEPVLLDLATAGLWLQTLRAAQPSQTGG